MVLAIDVGNTNIVVGAVIDGKVTVSLRIKTDKYKTADEYAVLIKELLNYKQIEIGRVDGAIISSVVPPLLPELKTAFSKILNCKVLTVSPGIKTGLNIKIDDPSILGADLVCGAVGAINRYTTPCIVIDLGTATKFLAIDKDGSFLGGPILPGIGISLDALSRQTAQLPHIEFGAVKHVIGKNSVDSMRSGTVYGTACMLDGMIERISEEMKAKPQIIITGGFAEVIKPYCKTPMEYEPNLVLYGAYDIYKKNVK